MDRRDIPPEDRYGGGQSYRPGNTRIRSPPPRRNDDFNRRSPPRRPFDSRGPPRGGRSRSPAGRDPYRRRTPSPRERFGVPRGGDSYRGRPRSPLRREDDLIRRDNPRDYRDERGPRDFGGRSPPRFRDRSDNQQHSFRGGRTPPGPRRDRSPPRRYGDRSPRHRLSPRAPDRDYPSRPRSPPIDSRAVSDRRPRSPSPRSARPTRDHDDGSRGSGATSRRSSPHVHASRLALVQDLDEPRSGRPSPRGPDLMSRPRTPDVREPQRDRDGDYIMDNNAVGSAPRMPEPPLGPSALRAPPTGPGSSRPALAPPAGPRGDAPRGGYAPRGRGGYSADYGTPGRSSITTTFRGRGGAPVFDRGPSYDRQPVESTPRTFNPPALPRSMPRGSSTSQRFDVPASVSYDSSRESRPSLSSAPSDPYRRPPTGPSAISSASAPRETRAVDVVHPAMRNLPEPVAGGKKFPPLADQTRLNKLEEESERLRKLMLEKDARKRKNLRDWDRLVREGESAAYRSEVAETSVRAFDGDGEIAGPAF